jgi:hypothetical protein
MLTFFSKTIAQRTAPGQRQSVQNNGKQMHIVNLLRSNQDIVSSLSPEMLRAACRLVICRCKRLTAPVIHLSPCVTLLYVVFFDVDCITFYIIMLLEAITFRI